MATSFFLSLTFFIFRVSVPPTPTRPRLLHTLFKASDLSTQSGSHCCAVEANPHYCYLNANEPEWIAHYEQSQAWALASFENLFASTIYIKPHFASPTAHIQNPAADKSLVT